MNHINMIDDVQDVIKDAIIGCVLRDYDDIKALWRMYRRKSLTGNFKGRKLVRNLLVDKIEEYRRLKFVDGKIGYGCRIKVVKGY